MDILLIICLFLATVLLADLISGLVHWFEDAYAKPNMPLLDRIARENKLHHDQPRAFLQKNWWQSSYDLLALGLLIVGVAWWQDVLTVWVWLFVAVVVNANQIHKWTHQNRQEKPSIVHYLQKCRVLQTPREHAKHHSGNKDTHYCVITNALNPLLERLHFWQGLEWLVYQVTGIKRIGA
jgi:hypothetical protein